MRILIFRDWSNTFCSLDKNYKPQRGAEQNTSFLQGRLNRWWYRIPSERPRCQFLSSHFSLVQCLDPGHLVFDESGIKMKFCWIQTLFITRLLPIAKSNMQLKTRHWRYSINLTVIIICAFETKWATVIFKLSSKLSPRVCVSWWSRTLLD